MNFACHYGDCQEIYQRAPTQLKEMEDKELQYEIVFPKK